MARNLQLQVRRGTSSQWTTANPVLAQGEPGLDTTNNQIRYGDGSTPWSGLTPVGASGLTPLLQPTLVQTSTYTANPGDLVLVNTDANGFAVNLPNAPSDKTQVGVKQLSASGNAVTITAQGSDVFESGSTTYGNPYQYREITFQYQASTHTWIAISMYLTVSSLNIPNGFSDLSGAITDQQLVAGGVMYTTFTSANYTTVVRPTTRTDLLVIWMGDSTTSSTTIPTNSLAGDLVLTKSS